MGTLLSSPSFYYHLGHTKRGDNDILRAVFARIWVSWDPQTLQNKGKRKMTNRSCLTSQGHHSRGTTLSKALRGSVPIQEEMCPSEGCLDASAGSLQGSAGLRGVLQAPRNSLQ